MLAEGVEGEALMPAACLETECPMAVLGTEGRVVCRPGSVMKNCSVGTQSGGADRQVSERRGWYS